MHSLRSLRSSVTIDTHANYLELKEGHLNGQEAHPLAGLTMAQTGAKGGPMVGDTYDLPPGVVSRERHGLSRQS